MTAIEVFQEITSKPKWYDGFVSAQNATNIKRRFCKNELSFAVLQKMFNHYGYFLKNDSPWVKIESNDF